MKKRRNVSAVGSNWSWSAFFRESAFSNQRDWLFSTHGLVTIGGFFSYEAPQEEFYVQGPLGVWFDVMIHLQHVTAARPLP